MEYASRLAIKCRLNVLALIAMSFSDADKRIPADGTAWFRPSNKRTQVSWSSWVFGQQKAQVL